ncbi:putative HTH-type transcriptional regulator YxaF [Clostridium ragsdalei P11]|uniref:Putative HTH-type transcriptional regulator YxaF n=1 Tax=Clostridium ragsdalei P11 TaxID=1353534 RepID=A0A1A6AI01_9CLOT|nr:TetR/AcrR family transcriptional regulator [Clostridium ragsdalei]OBR89648.1 putative HTH-type transcriptional regulator YxaF [Clostridium ragsdalei P11]
MKNKTYSREKILTAASMLFQVKGYNAAGLNEILKESGSPKGSLYYYFPGGKEELALESIKLANEAIQNKLQTTLNEHSNPIEAIQSVIKNIIEDLKRDGKLKDISLSLIALETYLSIEPLRKACELAFLDIQNTYTKKLIEGGFSKETAQELGIFIQVIVEGAITASVTEKNPIALLTVSKQIGILLNSYIN